MLVGTYNPWLVAISLLVAVMASYTALAMAGRTITAPGKAAAWWWRLGGGFAMGLGIWSMHFIGMLAFDLPIPLGYDLPITLLSLALAIASSVFALWLVSLRTLPHPRLAGGALLMGTGIAGMHYVGMAAMRMQPGIDYDPGWLLLSLMVAVAASWTALYVAFRLRGQRTRIGDRLAAAGLLGRRSSACTTPAWPLLAFRRAASAAQPSATACRANGWPCWWWCCPWRSSRWCWWCPGWTSGWRRSCCDCATPC